MKNIGIYQKLSAWGRSLFAPKVSDNFKPVSDPHKKKTRAVNHGKRRFEFLGCDGNLHMARVGKPFKVRPSGLPHVFIATWENRGFIEVKS